ncbi:hypothetical protein RGQ29_005804 [Quercus rubra]|uniref:Uncharacterized protein n=1 Tax=Quercus rubra TaxID=3512 RepID=A0AAN7E591_QUERU|nr:hypothetical protein RGQ29_005804 [Quercus rubra]
MASLLSKDAFGSGSGSNQEQSEQCDSYRLSADVSESESCSNNFSCQQFETKCGASSSMTSSSRPVAINFLFPTSVMLSVIGGKEWWFGTRRSPRNRKPICPGTVKEVFRCNITLTSENSYNVKGAIPYHKNLTNSGLQILVFSDDHDMSVTHIAVEERINSLDLTIDTEWRPWFVDGQVAGYTRKYTNSGYCLTYATIKGARHSPTEYKRKECYDMFHRWIHYYPL